MRNPHKSLPATWVWTRRGFGAAFDLYACRDTRWDATVPDAVSIGERSAIAYAYECDKVTARCPEVLS